jgi:hypothetical protein
MDNFSRGPQLEYRAIFNFSTLQLNLLTLLVTLHLEDRVIFNFSTLLYCKHNLHCSSYQQSIRITLNLDDPTKCSTVIQLNETHTMKGEQEISVMPQQPGTNLI